MLESAAWRTRMRRARLHSHQSRSGQHCQSTYVENQWYGRKQRLRSRRCKCDGQWRTHFLYFCRSRQKAYTRHRQVQRRGTTSCRQSEHRSHPGRRNPRMTRRNTPSRDVGSPWCGAQAYHRSRRKQSLSPSRSRSHKQRHKQNRAPELQSSRGNSIEVIHKPSYQSDAVLLLTTGLRGARVKSRVPRNRMLVSGGRVSGGTARRPRDDRA
mmetsp:Transcript_107627/g.202266  ORF Transcript_107627/g.202266 Transcript_107627/m.202266 type:complete len:211 (-) Transcript_107627:251-883(-)